jgi:glycosyltransferase involved in cell wall biosynthesis
VSTEKGRGPKVALSVVIPAFNEAARLGATLRTVLQHFTGFAGGCEIIVVDDGSDDQTHAVAEACAPKAAPLAPALRVLRLPRNRGKGFAVRSGLMAAKGTYWLFSDADLSTPVSWAETLLSRVKDGRCDVAIGSRAVDRRMTLRRQALHRDWLGRCFNVWVRALTGLSVYDTQCGFKAMRAAPVAPLVRAMRLDGYGFDVELLGLCAAAGLRICEIPVVWRHADGSKVMVMNDGWRMLRDAARYARWQRQGVYDAALAEARRAIGAFAGNGS